MLLALDVGNTNIVIGVCDAAGIVASWRVTTSLHRTADEYAVVVRALLRNADIDPRAIHAAIVSSVVPPLRPILDELVQRAIGHAPLWVEPGIKTGVKILYDDPKQVGADRIVNAVAAVELYAQPGHGFILVDMGTATTIDCVTPDHEYLGGAIAPGLAISMDALFTRASKLPRVDFARPPHVTGRNTVQSIQAGLYFGYAGLVDRIVAEMKSELKFKVRVLATGGLAGPVAEVSNEIDQVVPDLTLWGLKLLHERNAPKDTADDGV